MEYLGSWFSGVTTDSALKPAPVREKSEKNTPAAFEGIRDRNLIVNSAAKVPSTGKCGVGLKEHDRQDIACRCPFAIVYREMPLD